MECEHDRGQDQCPLETPLSNDTQFQHRSVDIMVDLKKDLRTEPSSRADQGIYYPITDR